MECSKSVSEREVFSSKCLAQITKEERSQINSLKFRLKELAEHTEGKVSRRKESKVRTEIQKTKSRKSVSRIEVDFGEQFDRPSAT